MRLEKTRRCKWRGDEACKKIVWAGRGSAAEECPKTAIEGQSIAWLEMWATWRACGKGFPEYWCAKDLDAMAALEREWERMQDEARRLRD